MAKRYRNLIGQIVAPANMMEAYRRTARGRRMTAAYLEFKEWAEVSIDALAAEMADGTYRPDPPSIFTVYEPKPRLISAQSFRDRVAQHALCAVIGPALEATLLPRTFACREGLGTHAGVKTVQADLRAMGPEAHVLKTDFSKYFHSIDRAVLTGLIRKKISCAATLRLIEAITPATGHGLPIGALTSQLYANVYGGMVDRFIHTDHGHRRWARYMDDIVVIAPSASELRDLAASIATFADDRMGLRFSKWSVQPVSRGANFLGYRIWPNHKLLRRQSVVRARRRIEALRRRGDHEALAAFLAAWLGHARWADTHNLFRTLQLEPME